MIKSFTAQLKDFADKSERRMLAVARESVQDVMQDAQTPVAQGGRMRVKTGFLRNSVASGLNGSFGPPGGDSYLLAISGMQLGDVVRFAWTAFYALPRELGSRGQSGDHFVGVAAAKWPQFVEANAARLR
jgi:hypothetical protein